MVQRLWRTLDAKSKGFWDTNADIGHPKRIAGTYDVPVERQALLIERPSSSRHDSCPRNREIIGSYSKGVSE